MELLYVPDPTIILRWAYQADDPQEQDRALDLLHLWLEGGCEFLLPSLWAHELGSILYKKSPDKAVELMELFIGFRFSEVKMSPELAQETLTLMDRFSVDFYSAVYHAVAQRCGGTLVTADIKYYRKAKGAGRITLLKDLVTP
jgi:predicted nucleic acid-binding protein